MMNIVEFALLRMAEDEARAQAVVDEHPMWDWDGYLSDAGHHDGNAANFARHIDPDRILADTASRRRIVEIHRAVGQVSQTIGAGIYRYECCPVCNDGDNRFPCDTIRALVSAYSSHPDYRDEWKP